MTQAKNQSYSPLLPKTDSDFTGGDNPGEWISGDVGLFNRLGNSLEFEAGRYAEVNSIPSPWSRLLQYISAVRNPDYPTRDWLLAQYRGLLATLALADNLKLKIDAVEVNLADYQQNEFGRCLEKLKPNASDSIFNSITGDDPWSQLYIFELEEIPIAITSPATLVCPTGNLPTELSSRVAWIKDGFFTEPAENGLSQAHKQVLAPWLDNLKLAVIRDPKDEKLAGYVANVIDEFRQSLGVPAGQAYEPSPTPRPYGAILAPSPLDALNPAKAITQKSNVRVIPSQHLNPQKQLYLVDHSLLPNLMGRTAQEIIVIDAAPLLNFDANRYQRGDATFVTPADLFHDEIYFSETPGLLPGTWLDAKLGTAECSVLLPLKSWIRDYFTSQDLEQQVALETINMPEGPGIRVSMSFKLSGFDRPIMYSVYKDFLFKTENNLSEDLPTIAIWPNLPPTTGAVAKWKEYFLLVERSEENDYPFYIEEPVPGADMESHESRQQKYEYWKCNQRPDILSAVDKEGQPIGLLPLSRPKLQAGSNDTWAVGVDFGTSFTNVSVRKGNGNPEPLKPRTNLLKVTLGSEVKFPLFHDEIYRDFFIPDRLLPENQFPPLSTALTTRGWQIQEGAIPEVILNARIYNPRLDGTFSDNVRTNIKWEHIEYQRPFLGQLIRMIAVQAALEGVKVLTWSVSFPSAFSTMEVNTYTTTWERVLSDVGQISGQTHRFDPRGFRTESLTFAQFFADTLGENLVHTTCIDIGGGTSDISIWQDNDLVHQASVPYAGRDIFSSLLKQGLPYLSEIFGLSHADGEKAREFLNNQKTNFNSALDVYLRANTEKLLQDNYPAAAGKPRNREFRTLVAFAYGGLFHYLGLVQKWLIKEGKMSNDFFTTTLLGGNGSRFIHWLSPSGSYGSSSEINQLLEGILVRASELQPNARLLKLSHVPKEETCGGLIVPPGGEKLKGLDRKTEDDLFSGEACVINGQSFDAYQRLKLPQDWEEIREFTVSSTTELENYLVNFNAIIRDEKIEEIDALRNFKQGGLLTTLDDQLRNLLNTTIKQACLRKKGSTQEFEAEPPFLLTLKSLLMVLATQWQESVKN